MDSENQENDTDDKSSRRCSVHAVIVDGNLYLLLGQAT